ncbi:MAG: radical SAM protein [Candidatus Margulisbacteria bacterium]|nr:radical SAM protein [Candidatus Margulisiibacteriota bacterium]MBU1021905.1 radical SAM protein [Candidatus Margulisiibacteriota bacterium]MBU1728543.1 radical SAM protein [Candidatus Margulisiibacteriota bacterium]MBU1954690.1 radical SAM protein [Candidatus Margulisiibacteriota bacterium]
MENSAEKIKQAYQLLNLCIVCPRDCKVNRLIAAEGFCRAGVNIRISSALVHRGEEPPISGTKGSGTIFFSGCNMACQFCQNFEISQEDLGHKISEKDLAEEMLKLQKQGVHNINLVSPTHFGPQILKTLVAAKEKGLKIPIVYNSNGYDDIEMLGLFNGLIDIYMPDIKYGYGQHASKYSNTPRYVESSHLAIEEMFKQVGPLKVDANGVATRGLLIRHLVLPNRISGTFDVLKYIASISTEIWVSIMSQYFPTYCANQYPEINRALTQKEYQEVVDYAKKLGFESMLLQQLSSSKTYRPNFKQKDVFKEAKE